ncbi:ABC transporter permease [Krasilnikoviella flava]|uniref:ABC-2 type transport system permease protein n=1 Tax=Krasilnikoviella flava TaxID=526729 RepID=A0A1T5KVW4_9MICO|nr:ABC transporter permease [Krasilnikoviella flava]SKC67916.1 ABC-2 type transport system permease protein [Krasilnikoviella flava]
MTAQRTIRDHGSRDDLPGVLELPEPGAPPRAVRPGAGAWLALTVAEARMVARDTAGLVIPLGMPLLILVMNGLAPGLDQVVPGTGGRTALDVSVIPLTLTMVVATVGVINMPSFLAYYRRTGVLRRLGVTPASPAMVLGAQAFVGVAQILLGIALALGVAFVWLGASPPADPWVAAGVLALAIAAMYAVGMLVAAVAPTPGSAVAIGLVAFFALAALGGMFGSRENLPDALATLGGWLPFGAAVDALGGAWAGLAVPLPALVGLGAGTVVAGGAAAVWFRWD